MREIVDRHFYDTWVLPFYLGYLVDLTINWLPYKAAKHALRILTDKSDTILKLCQSHCSKVPKLIEQLETNAAEGKLTEEILLQNSSQLLNLLR
mmetsp:Transcript_3507/g.2095  ORF Transcript_3507/g.2095 Transcript_3507/m.2095 type:complete len:94 (-) Transcript_3507:462-743(-)